LRKSPIRVILAAQGRETPLRLFIGLPLPAEHRLALDRHLAPWRAEHPRLKWVKAAQFHFTLQFLGEAPPAKLDALLAALGHLAARPDFTLETGGLFALPPGARARVLALGLLSGASVLGDLAAAVQRSTEALGFAPERRAFKAHLTLARVRRGEKLALRPAEIGRPPLPAFPATSFHLYESELRPEGPIYRSRLEVRLKPA